MDPQDTIDRRLTCEPCLNIRDVGGYRTSDGATIRWRTLLRGDNLCQLTPAGSASLLGHGLRTVIDLRHISELEEAIHPFGPSGPHASVVEYQPLGIRNSDNSDFEAAFLACQSLQEMYLLYLDRSGPRFAAIARAIADAPEGAVIVHCHVGKDRTGIVVALLLALAGVPTETIVADYALSFGYLRPLWEEQRAAGLVASDEAWHSKPATMQAFLEHLERVHGGAERYLLTAGLTADEIERLRVRLRDETGNPIASDAS
jgi:protein-tyrosine phosphatase